jgi:hypothetical protein
LAFSRSTSESSAASHESRTYREKGDDESESEDETTRRARLRKTEQEADLAHAEDLFGVSLRRVNWSLVVGLNSGMADRSMALVGSVESLTTMALGAPLEELRQQRQREKGDDESESEDETTRRARLRKTEQDWWWA